MVDIKNVTQSLPKGYKHTEIGIIPEDWSVEKIDSIAKISTGGRDTQDRESEGAYPFYVRSNTVERINSYSFDGEAILTSGDGVGVGKIFHYVTGKFDFHQRVYNIYDYTESVSGKYLFLQFSNNFYDRVMSMTAKSSVDSVRREMIADMKIPLPPTKVEQEAIANALSDMDALISNLDTLIAKKKAIKKGAMQQLLTGKTRVNGFEKNTNYKQTEIGEIPEDWKVFSLAELGEFKNGVNKSKEQFGYGKPFVNLLDVFGVKYINTNKHLGLINTNDEEQTLYSLRDGDVLFIRSSVKPSGVGLTAVIKGDLEGTVFSGFLIRFRANQKIHNTFKIHCFNENGFRNRLIATSSVSANTNINQDSLKQLKIPLPTKLEEQESIATILSDMDTELEALQAKKEKYSQLKQGMAQELLTGKTRLV